MNAILESIPTKTTAGNYYGRSGYMAIRDPSRWRFVYTVEHFWHGADLLALAKPPSDISRACITRMRITSIAIPNWLPMKNCPCGALTG